MSTNPTMQPHRPQTRGFTIVEIVLALILLTVSVLGLAGTTTWVVRQTTLGQVTSERTVALQSTIEQLRAMPYDSVMDGSSTEGQFAVRWFVTTDSRSKRVELVTTGPGLTSSLAGPPQLAQSVADTFEYRVYSR